MSITIGVLLLLLNQQDLQLDKTLELAKKTYEEVSCLTQNIYFEARGESLKGQAAVRQVTLNRVHSSNYPDTVCKVVKQYKQFSWYWDDKSDKMTELEAKQKARKVALGLYTSEYPNPVGNSTYYHNFSVSPGWATELEVVTIIGGHIFFK